MQRCLLGKRLLQLTCGAIFGSGDIFVLKIGKRKRVTGFYCMLKLLRVR
jgi:hypothetical protein